MKPVIILLDDIEANLLLMEGILSDLDIEIIQATSGSEALEIVRKNEIALIISDVQMPEMNGFEFLNQVRKIEGAEFIPVIFISAIYTDEENILKGIQTGAIDFIPKPFNHNILLGKVEIFIQLYLQKKSLNNLIEELSDKNKELEQSKEIIEKITNAAYDGIFLVDDSAKIVFSNTGASQIFNYVIEELTKKNINELFAKQKLQKKIIDEINDFFKTGIKTFNNVFELNTIRKNGEIFPAEYALTPIIIDNKQHTVVIIRNITERKINEQKLLGAKEQKEANKTMSDFIDNISHELTTPINSINGILKDIIKTSDSLTEVHLEALNLAYNSGKHLESVVNNILHFKTKYSIQYKEVKLNELVKVIREFCNEIIKRNEVKYSVNAVSIKQNITIHTDENKLLLSIFNIIENSVKYTLQGSIDITLALIPDKLEITVTDTGIGMKEDELSFIFEMFKQGYSANDRKYSGLGLGLTIAKQNITSLGGTIKIESKLKEGTTIIMTVPLN